MATKTKTDRVVTNEDIIRYNPMVEKWMRDSVEKNWTEASTKRGRGDVSLGNSGHTMEDIRQHLRTEVVIALKNFDPTKETKESTFVWNHLYNRIGQLMKRLTKKSKGYGVWTNNLETILREIDDV